MKQRYQSAPVGQPIPCGVDEALRLASALQWAVFPLIPDTGKPFGNEDVADALGVQVPDGGGGFHFATVDETSIRKMWQRFPHAQIGIATGAKSGIYVIDIDTKNEKNGFEWMQENGWTMPETFWVGTKSGGKHYFFSIPRDGASHYPSTCRLKGGVDLKGDGGFVRWYGGAYGFSGNVPMADPPEWALESSAGSPAVSSSRHPLGSMPAPSFAAACTALESIDPNDLGHDEWVSRTAAFRQAATGLAPEDEVRRAWDAWCARYEGNNPGENGATWRSFDRGTQVGWADLRSKASPEVQAELVLGGVQPISQGIEMPVFGEILTPAEQSVYFSGLTLVGPENRIIDSKGHAYEPGAFNSTYGGKQFVITATGKVTDEAWKAATRSTVWTVPKVDSVCFRPDRPPAEIVIDELGRRSVNTYWPATIDHAPGDPSPFLKHLESMLRVESDRKLLLDYLAHNVRFPGHKIPWAPLIQSTEGAGKNVLKYAITHSIGDIYVYQPNAKELGGSGGKFNGWMDRKLFFIADEIKVDDRREMVEILKPMISERTLEVQSKGRDQRKADNPANWLFFSNHRDAIPIHANGRRYAVFYSALQSQEDLQAAGMNDAYFKRLYDDWLGYGTHKSGLRIVANYLLNYPIERGELPMRAPHTSSTSEALIESRGWLAQVIAEAVEDGRPGFRGGWISTAAVAKLPMPQGRQMPTARTVGDSIKEMGYHKIGQFGGGIFQEDCKRPNLWHLNPNESMDNYKRAQGYENDKV